MSLDNPNLAPCWLQVICCHCIFAPFPTQCQRFRLVLA
jgi:hypothetical protein